jgi:hypothetical protein
MRIWKFMSLALLGVVLLGASSPSNDPNGEKDIQFSNPELSVSGALGGCGHACLYTKANDVLTLQTTYMINLADKLIQERAKLDVSETPSDERKQVSYLLRRNLKPYCTAQKIFKLSDDDQDDDQWGKGGDRCFGNYLNLVARSIEANRDSLLKNYRTIVNLAEDFGAISVKEGQVSPANTEKILKNRALLKDPKLKLYPDFPFHPAFEAIDPVVKRLGEVAHFKITQRAERFSGRSQQEKTKADEDLATWWDNFPKCPSRDEYAKVEFVERYPGKQTGEKLPVVAKDPKTGRIEIDLQAFNKASAECVEKQKQAFREMPIPPEILKEGASVGAMTEKREAFELAQEQLVETIAKKVKESKASKEPKESKEYTVSIFGDGKKQLAGVAAPERALIDDGISRIRGNARTLLERASKR